MERTLPNWLIRNSIVMTIALLLAYTTNLIFWLPLIAFISFFTLFYFHKQSFSTFISSFSRNYANQITALRFIISSLTALAIYQIPAYASFILFGFAILLDGLDGFIARKYQLMSEVGAIFDKTVDAYFVLLLAFILVTQYNIPIWFLAIGYLHYGYELLMHGLGWQYLTIPKNPIGKLAAAFLFISLLSPFIFSPSIALFIIYLASITVSLSFGFSFFYKYKAASVSR